MKSRTRDLVNYICWLIKRNKGKPVSTRTLCADVLGNKKLKAKYPTMTSRVVYGIISFMLRMKYITFYVRTAGHSTVM